MRQYAIIAGIMAAVLLCPSAGSQQIWPWWVSGELGEGQLKLSSDQVQGKQDPTFALGFAGGHQLGTRARAGLHVNGWLLQAFSLNDPTVGESVTNVMGVVDVYPLRNWSRVFLRGGLGRAIYAVNNKFQVGGSGVAWESGVGCEIPLRRGVSLLPTIAYSAGRLGDVHIPAASQTGRRYSVVEFKIGVLWHFGRSRVIGQ